MSEPYIISEENAERIADWLERGTVSLYTSVNFSNMGIQWLVPSDLGKPDWQAADKPDRVMTIDDFVVVKFKEVKRFRVGIRMGGQGLMFKVTDGGTRRIRAEIMKAGKGAFHNFDYSTQEAVIWKVDGEPIPLVKWLKNRDKRRIN